MPGVVRLITRLNIGGPSIQAVTLSDRLRALGFETVLAHGRLGPGEGDMSYLLSPSVEAEQILDLQRAISPLDDIRAIRRVLRLLRRVRPAILHTHMAKAGAVGRAAAMLYNRRVEPAARVRLVHTYHGHVLEGYFSPLKTAVFIRTEQALARATDRLIAISPQIRRDLLRHVSHRTRGAVRRRAARLRPHVPRKRDRCGSVACASVAATGAGCAGRLDGGPADGDQAARALSGSCPPRPRRRAAARSF